MEAFFSLHGADYQAIHSHICILDSIIFTIAKRKGVRYRISHSHSVVYSHKRLNSIRNRILCVSIEKQATHYFACSEEAGKHLFPHTSPDNIYILHNAIDLNRFAFSDEKRQEIRNKLGIMNCVVIGHVGRFYPIKNQKYLVDIMAELNKISPEYVLVLVGDGEQRNEVEQYAKDKGIYHKILFLGKRTDVHDLLQGFDIFVMPSLNEGIPVVAVEAQASGLPCLLSDSIPWRIRNSDLVSYETLSVNCFKWVEQIEKIAQKKERRSRTEELRAAGYDIHVESKKLEQFYQSLMNC